MPPSEADEALWFHLPTVGRLQWPVMLVHHDHDMLVDIDAEDPGAPALRGICIEEERRIYINASLATSSLHETALHESIHAVLYDTLSSRLLKSSIAADMEEAFTVTVAPILSRVARPRWPAFPPEALAVIRAARRRRRRAA